MAGYSLRSLADLGIQARGFFTQSVPGAVAALAPNTLTVIGKVLALLGFEHELRRQWLVKQLFASTADEVWLKRHGYELGLTQTPASVASGTITIAAASGVPVPTGLLFVGPDGATFTTVAGATTSGNSVKLSIEANLGGVAGNVAAGTTLSLDPSAAIVTGLGSTAIVDAPGMTGGSNAETVEGFRSRVLARKRNPPQGGSAPDYALWTRETLPVVRDVYVDRYTTNAGRVWIQFTVEDQPNGIPSAGQVAIVQSYLSDPVRRPVTADPIVTAPIADVVPVTISGLVPDAPDVRATVATELAAVFADRAAPGTPTGGAFLLSRSWLSEAVSRATGEDRHVLVSPSTDLSFAAGHMPVLGPITFA